MDVARLIALLREQQEHGFTEVAGARASVTLPISDRLVSRFVSEAIPPTAAVREADFRASDGNRFSVRVRLSRPALMPPITVNFAIERQPELPADPVIVLRLLSTGLLSFAGPALRFLNVLPPGIKMDGDRIFVNIRTLIEQRGFGQYLGYLEDLAVTTEDGRFIVTARAALPRVER